MIQSKIKKRTHMDSSCNIPELGSFRKIDSGSAALPALDSSCNIPELGSFRKTPPGFVSQIRYVVGLMLILASASPWRHELLLAAGIDHVVHPASIPELRYSGEAATEFVQRIAREKATAAECGVDDIVLGADTIVCLENEVFGKPANDEDAVRMLRALSGRDHWVYTGICILTGNRLLSDLASTKVSFVELTEDEIRGYTRSGEPRDKAGGYAIQGLASKFVSSIQGCHHNVVGLPVSLVYRHLRAL